MAEEPLSEKLPHRLVLDRTQKKAAPSVLSGFWYAPQPAGQWVDYKPAAAFSAAALSVRSQVKSGSSRPKWP
jgi:hypothetical protein